MGSQCPAKRTNAGSAMAQGLSAPPAAATASSASMWTWGIPTSAKRFAAKFAVQATVSTRYGSGQLSVSICNAGKSSLPSNQSNEGQVN